MHNFNFHGHFLTTWKQSHEYCNVKFTWCGQGWCSHHIILRFRISFLFHALIQKILQFKMLVYIICLAYNWNTDIAIGVFCIYRGYYMVARRYEFYFRVAKQYFTNERSEWVKYCFCHEKIKFISSSRRVMFFLLYRQNDIDKIIEGNYQNYVIDKLTCEIMENKPLGSRM